MKNLCSCCANVRQTVGSAHVRCINSPLTRLSIGSGGPERYEKAAKMATDEAAVVRCIWPGSGFYPGGELVGYDSNTVFACANFEKKE